MTDELGTEPAPDSTEYVDLEVDIDEDIYQYFLAKAESEGIDISVYLGKIVTDYVNQILEES